MGEEYVAATQDWQGARGPTLDREWPPIAGQPDAIVAALDVLISGV